MTTTWKLAALALAVSLTAACQREQRRFTEAAPASGHPRAPEVKTLPQGGPGSPPTSVNPYANNAWAVSEGKRLYEWFNCKGCHAAGGGGMGPPLMTGRWRYGGTPIEIYASIIEGRSNGMPAFGSKISAQQAWQLAAYVESMSGQLRKDVRQGRDDHMQVKRQEQSKTPEPPR